MAESEMDPQLLSTLLIIRITLNLLCLVVNLGYALKYLRSVKMAGYRAKVKIMLVFLIISTVPEFSINVWQLNNDVRGDKRENYLDQKTLLFLIQLIQAVFHLLVDIIYLIFGFYIMNLEVTMDTKITSAFEILRKIIRLQRIANIVIIFAITTALLNQSALILCTYFENHHAEGVVDSISFYISVLIKSPLWIYLYFRFIKMAIRFRREYEVLEKDQ